jgi:elongation factor 3
MWWIELCLLSCCLQWRFASGEDRESFEKASRQITEEEEKKMAQVVMFNGQKLVVEQV